MTQATELLRTALQAFNYIRRHHFYLSDGTRFDTYELAVAIEKHLAEPEVPTYSRDEVEATMCMWEHTLEQLREHTDSLWIQFQRSNGAAELRGRVLDQAKRCEVDYVHARDRGYGDTFDWDFVPEWMEKHIEEILN